MGKQAVKPPSHLGFATMNMQLPNLRPLASLSRRIPANGDRSLDYRSDTGSYLMT